MKISMTRARPALTWQPAAQAGFAQLPSRTQGHVERSHCGLSTMMPSLTL